jgi:hypothetical protein
MMRRDSIRLLATFAAAAVRAARRRVRAIWAAAAMTGIVTFCCAHATETYGQSTLKQLFDQVPGLGSQAEAAAREAEAGVEGAAQPTSEAIPPPTIEGRLPPAGVAGGIEYVPSTKAGMIDSLVVRDASLSEVLELLGQSQGLNIIAANDIDAIISITLRDVPVDEALTAILQVANYTWVKRNNIILVTSLISAANLPADTQGRQIQVFELNYASAAEVQKVITAANLLSPIGKVSISESDAADNSRTREIVVVEDLPHPLARVASYIAQVDQPPRQVSIEAHILQVTLKDDMKFGVNFDALFRAAGATGNFVSAPSGALAVPNVIAPPTAGSAVVATFAAHDLETVIEALQTTGDTKSLGSPKILVLDKQRARMNVGKSIGVQSSTQTELQLTQTATGQEVGVILEIVPRITDDGRVLLNVKPEVSDGEFNPESNAVDTVQTKFETDVMLRDGEGMVIGGLIKETDTVNQSKIPVLGDIKGVGWLFRRSQTTKERVEIIVTIVPRIQPYEAEWQAFEQGEVVRTAVPLFEGPLRRMDRPWDPVLPDGERVHRPLIPRHLRLREPVVPSPVTRSYVVPPYPLPQQRFEGEWYGTTEPLPVDGPARAFLSDEEGPVVSEPYWPKGAIISDQ